MIPSQLFLQELAQLLAEKHLLLHPFYQRWTAGTLSKEVLQKYAEQYYHVEHHFPRFLSQIHTRCDSFALRQLLSDNLHDEESGDENHRELWLRFGEGLGCSREKIENSIALPETQIVIDVFDRLCRASFLEGVAALTAYESQIPEVARTKLQGLNEHYGVKDTWVTAFFSVHMVADEKHRAAWWRVIQDEIQTFEKQRLVFGAMSLARDALWGFLDGVCRVHMPEALLAA